MYKRQEFIRSKSAAAAGLCSWGINIVRFYEVYCDVEPKRKALEEANQELEDARYYEGLLEKWSSGTHLVKNSKLNNVLSAYFERELYWQIIQFERGNMQSKVFFLRLHFQTKLARADQIKYQS